MDELRSRFVSTLLGFCAASLGQREDPPGSNLGPQIERYLRGWRDRYGKQYLGGARWCGLFAEYHVRAAYDAVDAICPISNAYWLGASSQWLLMGKKNGWLVDKPEPGDIGVLVREGKPVHTCVVRSLDRGLVYSVDGNSSDQVRNNARPLSPEVFGGFVRLPVVSARPRSREPLGPLLPEPSPPPAPLAPGADRGTPPPGA